MKKNKRILIIGIGSIGKNYLHEAIKKKLECFVFDLKYSPISSQNTSYISSKLELKKMLLKINIDYAVISSWTNSHFEYFKLLSKFNIKNILIEKPICSSIEELKEIKKIIKEKKIKIFSNYRWRLANVRNKINHLSDKYNLGEIISINSIGGAFCLSTGGFHILDLIFSLTNLKLDNINVYSKINRTKINPRNKNFFIYEGFINLYDKKNKFSASINYTNNSYLSPIQIINFREAVMYFTIDGKYKIYSSTKRGIMKKNPITKYELFNKLIGKGTLIRNQFNSAKISIDNIIKNKSLTEDLIFAPQILLFCALYSDKYKREMNNSNLNHLSKSELNKKWVIT